MSYKPPFARMRQIRRDAPPPIDWNQPANVEAALAQVPPPVEPEPEAVFVIEEPAPVVPAPVDEDPEVKDEKVKPDWSPQMKKAGLLSVALGMGLDVSESMTKGQIVAALQSVK